MSIYVTNLTYPNPEYANCYHNTQNLENISGYVYNKYLV